MRSTRRRARLDDQPPADDALERVRRLAPDALAVIEAALRDPDAAPYVKVDSAIRLIEIVIGAYEREPIRPTAAALAALERQLRIG